MDEIKLKCDIHVSVVLLYGDIKVCENNHGELIKSTAIIKISYICDCILLR